MRVERLGEGEPEVAVVGGIHGDEPCGVHAVEQLAAADPAVERPVALVVANEEALERGSRFTEEDLNRAFPGDPDGPTHESRLAARLGAELGDCTTLSLHSTQSYGSPFAIVQTVDEFARSVCPRLSVDAVVHAGEHTEGRVFESIPRTIEVECGFQGSETAAANALQIAREFLGAVDALPEAKRPSRDGVPVFRLREPVPKDAATSYEVFADNFEQVPAGSVFAAVDGREVVAEDDFYPVLMSAEGYEGLFGYAADKLDTLP
jgi:predicted deacylase